MTTIVDPDELSDEELLNLWPGPIKGLLQKRAKAAGYGKAIGSYIYRKQEAPSKNWGLWDSGDEKVVSDLSLHDNSATVAPNSLYSGKLRGRWLMYLEVHQSLRGGELPVNADGLELLRKHDAMDPGSAVIVFSDRQGTRRAWESPARVYARRGDLRKGKEDLGDYYYVSWPQSYYRNAA